MVKLIAAVIVTGGIVTILVKGGRKLADAILYSPSISENVKVFIVTLLALVVGVAGGLVVFLFLTFLFALL